MGLIEPIIAILLGSWFLGESLTSRALGGGLLILFSVWLAMAPAGAPARASAVK